MADVIVIAILMTYIGLNGLLESQLQSLNIKSDFFNNTYYQQYSFAAGLYHIHQLCAVWISAFYHPEIYYPIRFTLT
jgi:hypothetical protein